MIPVGTTTTDQYRIMSRPPGKRKFEFRHFSGAYPHNLDDVERVMERITRESPGWTFRVETRTVTCTATDWIPT